jgi:hypothetical protein
MTWVIALRELESQEIVLLDAEVEKKIVAGESPYGPEVHFVPCIEIDGGFEFGEHRFSRQCYCRPTIELGVNGSNLIRHRVIVN